MDRKGEPSGEMFKCNVTAAARIRAPHDSAAPIILTSGGDDRVSVFEQDARLSSLQHELEDTYYFDAVLDESSPQATGTTASLSQAAVFDKCGRQLVDAAVRGVNTTLLAYGCSNCGKTYTLFGDGDQIQGITQSIVTQTIAEVRRTKESKFTKLTFGVSVFELWNERARDLLSSGRGQRSYNTNAAGEFMECKVKPIKGVGLSVEGVREEAFDTGESFVALLSECLENRIKAGAAGRPSPPIATQSSCFVKVVMREYDKVRSVSKYCTMTFGDLCGSERANRVRSAPQSNVHLGLNALKTVTDFIIDKTHNKRTSLLQPTTQGVPYRDSCMSLLLSEALGGNSKTVVIAVMDPSLSYRDESLHTLQLITTMKHIPCWLAPPVEEAVVQAANAIEKELTLLRAAADSAMQDSTTKTSHMQEVLSNTEMELQRAAAEKARIESEREALRLTLQMQEEELTLAKDAVRSKQQTLDAAKHAEVSLHQIVEQQLSTSLQIASEVNLQEKRNTQIVFQRQRRNSLEQRHSSMHLKMAQAKRREEEMKRKTMSMIFKSATMMKKQRDNIRFYEREIEKMMSTESLHYARLRELHQHSSQLTAENSELQLKCDFLQEELDGVVEQWEAANRNRFESIADNHTAMHAIREETDSLRAEVDSISHRMDDSARRLECGRKEHAERIATLNDAIANLTPQLSAVELQAAQLDGMIAATESEVSMLTVTRDAMESTTALKALEEKALTLAKAERQLAIECASIEEQMDEIDLRMLPDVEAQLTAAKERVKAIARENEQLQHSNDEWVKFVSGKIFPSVADAAQ